MTISHFTAPDTLCGKLHHLLQRLLETDEQQYGELYQAADDLYHFLFSLTSIDGDDLKNHDNLMLESGKAISVNWAAFCIKEFMRTRKFMQAVLDATEDAVYKSAGEPVHILYAGTGPFATLVLPLTARYTSEQVKFTLLEIHDESFDSVQRLFDRLHINAFIHRLEKTDASTWQLPPGEKPAVFISETMQRGLKTEPQVAIYLSVIPQLPADTCIIPQQVTITAVMTDDLLRLQYKLGKTTDDHFCYPLGEAFVLNRDTILQKVKEYGRHHSFFPACTLAVPNDIPADNNLLELHTAIDIGYGHSLLPEESPLTMPLKLTRFTTGFPAAIQFQYEMGKTPGIKYELLGNAQQ